MKYKLTAITLLKIGKLNSMNAGKDVGKCRNSHALLAVV